jgi:hypothetical protein
MRNQDTVNIIYEVLSKTRTFNENVNIIKKNNTMSNKKELKNLSSKLKTIQYRTR